MPHAMADVGGARARAGLGALVILCAITTSCGDPREGRPKTTPKDLVTAVGTAPGSTTVAGPHQPVKLPGRCMKETPSEPVRNTPPAASNCPTEDEPRPELSMGTVGFEGSDKTVQVELAKEHEHRMRGLMWRTSMAEDDGMLFVFEDERPLSFYMRNTCIPLDMLFIAADGFIVNIEENTPTLTNQNFTSGSCKARYVLEVNAGWTRKNGIKAGMRVKLP